MFKDKLHAVALIVVLIVIIAIMCHMNQYYESYANYKCLQNGFKLAYPGKINDGGNLKYDSLMQMNMYDNIYEERYTPLTLDNNTRLYLNAILGQILNNINTKTNAKYMLRKIDSVNKERVKQGSISGHQVEREVLTRITVDFFAHELTKQETRRFIVIFTLDNKRNVNVEHVNLSNALNYNFRTKDSILGIPSPDGLIITDKALESSFNISGIDETTLDYSLLNNIEKVTSKNYGYAKPNEVAQALFLPSAVHDIGNIDDNGFFPNRKHTGWWDSNGVAIIEDPDCDKPKLGIDHAIGTRPFQPYDNPTVARYEGDAYKNKHHSLFDLARGNFLNGVVS
jgi:hypothetical protein